MEYICKAKGVTTSAITEDGISFNDKVIFDTYNNMINEFIKTGKLPVFKVYQSKFRCLSDGDLKNSKITTVSTTYLINLTENKRIFY
jgi:hypothetical protein